MSAEFLMTSLVVVLIPGTGVVYTVSSSLAGGRRRGLFAAVGCTLGVVPHIVAAMLGVSGIMQAGAVAFEVLRWAGVAYLVFMGVSMFFERGGLSAGSGDEPVEPKRVVIRRGIVLNLLNPKLTLFFFAFLPQFLTGSPGLLDAELLGLGTVFMALTLLVFAGYAVLSAAVRDHLLGSSTTLRWVQRALGALLIGFAVRLGVADR